MISNENNGNKTNYYTKNDISEELIYSIVNSIEDIFIKLGPEIVNNAGKSSFIVKKDGSPVTELDGQIENKIVSDLRELFPRLTIFGEESGYSDDLTDVCLLIDPIDGTKSFIKGTPNFTSMAVLIKDNEAVASVIYIPSSKKMFTAIRNKGAFVNGGKLDLRNVELPKTILAKKRDIDFIDRLLKLINISSKTAPSGGGYGFSRVAEGSAAARVQINAGGYIHDYAPGALLVQEAGGTVISLTEEKYNIRSKSFVVCHPALKDVFMENINELASYTENLRNKA